MSNEIYIKEYPFNNQIVDNLQYDKYWKQRPVVYILNNTHEAYVWETIDASIRAGQHKANPKRDNLNILNLITTDEFNKSVILDLESFLISHMSADRKYELQNWNWWLHNHNYYQKEKYQKQFKIIWDKLKERWLVRENLKELENSNVFKYSPYKSLTDEQINIVIKIKNQLLKDMSNKVRSTFIVKWWAWTWKTILWIYLMKFLLEIIENHEEYEEELENLDENIYDNLNDFLVTNKKIEPLKIWLVIPMKNLRKTLQDDVFTNISWLKEEYVLSPDQVAKSDDNWDILIVDESHRLRQRKNLPWASSYISFDKNNKRLWLDSNGNELDWIVKKSKYQIFLYDSKQSIKPTDIDRAKFVSLEQLWNTHIYNLSSQLRCIGWNRYIDYINRIISNEPPKNKEIFNLDWWYELKLFNDVNDLVNKIKELNNSFWLCRTLAWYAREWKTNNEKPKPKNEIDTKKRIEEWKYDIKIWNYKYIRNTVDAWWIPSENSINEIWCIHTSQWFDLNYAWIIIGNDLKYDSIRWLYVDKDEYYDKNWKNVINDYKILYDYILNIYRTMCTRWMLGTYIYACDKWLRDYLSKFIDVVE